MTPYANKRELETSTGFAWERNAADEPYPSRQGLDVSEAPECYRNLRRRARELVSRREMVEGSATTFVQVIYPYLFRSRERAESLNGNAKSRQHLAAPKTCDSQGSAVEILNHPFFLQRHFEERRSQSTADVGTPLTPIQATACKAAAQ